MALTGSPIVFTASGIASGGYGTLNAASTQVMNPDPAWSRYTLPRTWVDSRQDATYLSGGGRSSIYVQNDTDRASALTAVQRGQTVILKDGVVFAGQIIIPERANPTGAMIYWLSEKLYNGTWGIAEATRPTRANFSGCAVFERDAAESAIEYLDTATQVNCSGHRFAGFVIRTKPTRTSANYGLVGLGGGPQANTVAKMAHHFFFDRMLIHGPDFLTNNNGHCQRGIGLNCGLAAIVDSRIEDIWMDGQESQAILGYTGNGPYKIVNNFLSAAGENVMFGGAAKQGGTAVFMPADLEFRRNHVYKPTNWNQVLSGKRPNVKNLFELKTGQYLFVAANVFQNNWVHAQGGGSIFAQYVGDSNDASGYGTISDVTFLYNRVMDTVTGVGIKFGGSEGALAVAGRRIQIKHLLNTGLGNPAMGIQNSQQDGAQFTFIAGSNSNGGNDYAYEHTTHVYHASATAANKRCQGYLIGWVPEFGAGVRVQRGKILDNIFAQAGTSFIEPQHGISPHVTNVLNAMFVTSGGDAYDCRKNAFTGVSSGELPASNFNPANDAALGLDPTTYRPSVGSGLRSAASDGTDVGADGATINTLTSGVI